MHQPLFAEQEWTETGSRRAILATRSVAQHDCLDQSATCKGVISTSSWQLLFAWQRRVAIASSVQVTSIPWDDPRVKTSRGRISRNAEKAGTPRLLKPCLDVVPCVAALSHAQRPPPSVAHAADLSGCCHRQSQSKRQKGLPLGLGLGTS